MFILNLAVYVALLFLWTASLHTRLLPSRGRTYLLLSAVLMLFFLFQRAVKYRLAENGGFLEHFCWYTYYLPLALIPSLFLLTCLETLRDGKAKKSCAAR